MKNLIFISTLLAAGTLAANAETTLDYKKVGNFYYGTWYNDNELLYDNSSNSSGFYTFETSGLDFSKLESATFNIYLSRCDESNLKIWAVGRGNTNLDEGIAKDIIASANRESDFVSTSLLATQISDGHMLSIDITSVLKKIKQSNAVAILIGFDRFCNLDNNKGDRTTLSVEFAAVPEPSLFGLFAGTLALALAGTRRRRRK